MSTICSKTLYGLKTCSEMCDERFASIYLKSKGLCPKDEGVGAAAFSLTCRPSSLALGVLIIHTFAHAYACFAPSLWTCGKAVWGGRSRVLPGSRPSAN